MRSQPTADMLARIDYVRLEGFAMVGQVPGVQQFGAAAPGQPTTHDQANKNTEYSLCFCAHIQEPTTKRFLSTLGAKNDLFFIAVRWIMFYSGRFYDTSA